MSHSLVKVFVHFVWTTKNRDRVLVNEARRAAEEHIRNNAGGKKICIEDVGVQPEHVHTLVRLASDQPIEEVARLIKGESSYWINQNNVVPGKFSWQTGYAAFSVDYTGVRVVKQYIQNQDEHHRRRTYAEEVELMFREAGYSDSEIAEMLKVENR
jgi:putative transposase